MLKDELEAEKRKSMGIEEYASKKIQEYERNLNDENRKKKAIERENEELGKRNFENEEKMRDLLRELQIQKEKKKAMDELMERKTKKIEHENEQLIDKIRDDENQIREKMDVINKLRSDNDKADRVIRDLARQSDLNQMELEKIKDEIEIERRRTLAQEEGFNRKLQSLEQEKKRLE